MRNKQQQMGFTLLEVLICLFILSVLISIAPRLYPLLAPSKSAAFNEFEWTLFLEQMQIEFREAKRANVYGNKLILYDKAEKNVMHFFNGEELIRRVDGTGHEILLQNIQAVSYELSPSMLRIYIEDQNNKQHIGVVTRFHPLEENR
ncbi:MAG: competence type IV pilus minor pilin ComGF [Ectobacillus sp.]